MRSHDLVAALVESLDDDALAALAERLRPHLLPEDAGQLLDLKEAAARLGLHERTIARMAREGRLPGAVKVGREWRFPAAGLAPQPAPAAPVGPAPQRTRAPRNGRRRSVGAIRDVT